MHLFCIYIEYWNNSTGVEGGIEIGWSDAGGAVIFGGRLLIY
jgi:hypothetical protein